MQCKILPEILSVNNWLTNPTKYEKQCPWILVLQQHAIARNPDLQENKCTHAVCMISVVRYKTRLT